MASVYVHGLKMIYQTLKEFVGSVMLKAVLPVLALIQQIAINV